LTKHAKRGPIRAQKMAETKRRKAAGKVFLEFHEGTSWAHDKLASGTADLSPEGVVFMQREIDRRNDVKAHEQHLADENKAADLAAKLAANAEAEL
jgi:hypothetical protein